MSEPIQIKSLLPRANIKKPQESKKSGSIGSRRFLKQLELLLSKDIVILSSAFPDKLKESFYQELAVLMSAGLDIKTSLQLIGEEQTKKAAKTILLELLDKLVNGKSLSSVLKDNDHFTPYEYFTIEIGEETGKLIAVLQQLSIYYKSSIRQKRQIISALTYPAIVLSVAFISVSFMMNYVVPMFADVFKRFGGDLPYLTQQVLNISDFTRTWAIQSFVLFFVCTLVLYRSRKKNWYKRYKDVLLTRIPVIKDIISKIYLTRFASTMHLLLSAKVPLIQALDLSKQVAGFHPLEEALTKMEDDILKGQPLHESMAGKKVFPSKMVALVKVGEEVNQLDSFFKDLSDRYAEDLDYHTAQLGKFIEPVIIVVLGLVVGIVLIAMYLPMFSMGNSFE